jgi:hypothetical protein
MSAMRLVIILIILIGLGFLGLQITADTPDDDKIAVALDEATKTAIAKGEFTVPEEIIFVEPKDCEGTQWIKQQECSLNGKPMDGTEGSCGPGKEIWILDPTHSDFKPATGGGKCEPEERDCSVDCPKPCEGDTWTEGSCVRKEIKDGAIIETVLDGTAGKCGDGITTFNLDKTAPDYKPAVGTGSCVVEKGGACNVPCPVPEPPKCVEYAPGWQNNDMGCVRSQSDLRSVRCGQKGTKNQYRIPLDPKNCPELTRWVDCEGPPCPVNCEGSWSAWSAPKSDEPCGVQPYRERIFTITKQAAHGGYACDYPDGDSERRNAGTPKPCCEQTGDWAMVGSCLADGTAKYTQTYKENKPGGCPSSAKAKFMPCCYQKLDWTDTTGCNSMGQKTQKQTTAGSCPESVKTRQVNCPYIGPWIKLGGCGSDGKQYYRRDTVNSGDATSKSENCCYTSAWSGWTPTGDCNGSSRPHQRTRAVVNCPSGTQASQNTNKACNHCQGAWGNWSNWTAWSTTQCNRTGYRNRTRTYTVSKNATNGGRACPHENGHRETQTQSTYSPCRVVCFSPDTKIKLYGGNVVAIKDVMLGDVLEGGVTVNVTLQIRNIDKVPFYKLLNSELNEYIYVTGSHIIKEGDEFVRVDQSTKAEITDVFSDSLICLITDKHSIPIGEHIFWDWSDACDACDKSVI